MKHPFLTRTLAVAAVGLGLFLPMRAQAQPTGMPDLSDFAGAIANTADAAPIPKKTDGPFATGLIVPKVKPGVAATALVSQMRKALSDNYGDKMDPSFVAAWKEIETSMPTYLTAIENGMTKEGFKTRDMGVAYGLTLTTLFEIANDTELSDKADENAAKILALAFAKQYGDKFKTIAPAEKEKFYETILASVIVNSIMADALKQGDKPDELKSTREGTNDLFEKLIGVPATQVQISDTGDISGLAPDAE